MQSGSGSFRSSVPACARDGNPDLIPIYSAAEAVLRLRDVVRKVQNTIGPITARGCLVENTDYIGPRGRVQFDALHDVKDGPGFVNVLFVQWQNNGERVVIWPKEVANGKMINPPWLTQN